MAQRRSHAATHVTAPRALAESGPPFDVRAFLDSAGISRRIVRYARASVVFAQGGPANNVFYIQHGGGAALGRVPARQGGDRRHARAW